METFNDVAKPRVPTSLSLQQQAFCREYIRNGGDGAAAVKAAGYKSKEAAKHAYLLLQNPKIKAYVGKFIKNAEEKIEIDAEYLITQAKDVLERCMQQIRPLEKDGRPVIIETEDGEQVPAYTFDAANALRAIELMGKWNKLRMWSERVEVTGPGGGPIGMVTTEISEERAAELYAQMVKR